mgnify:CR=1 FL=1
MLELFILGRGVDFSVLWFLKVSSFTNLSCGFLKEYKKPLSKNYFFISLSTEILLSMFCLYLVQL